MHPRTSILFSIALAIGAYGVKIPPGTSMGTASGDNSNASTGSDGSIPAETSLRPGLVPEGTPVGGSGSTDDKIGLSESNNDSNKQEVGSSSESGPKVPPGVSMNFGSSATTDSPKPPAGNPSDSPSMTESVEATSNSEKTTSTAEGTAATSDSEGTTATSDSEKTTATSDSEGTTATSDSEKTTATSDSEGTTATSDSEGTTGTTEVTTESSPSSSIPVSSTMVESSSESFTTSQISDLMTLSSDLSEATETLTAAEDKFYPGSYGQPLPPVVPGPGAYPDVAPIAPMPAYPEGPPPVEPCPDNGLPPPVPPMPVPIVDYSLPQTPSVYGAPGPVPAYPNTDILPAPGYDQPIPQPPAYDVIGPDDDCIEDIPQYDISPSLPDDCIEDNYDVGMDTYPTDTPIAELHTYPTDTPKADLDTYPTGTLSADLDIYSTDTTNTGTFTQALDSFSTNAVGVTLETSIPDQSSIDISSSAGPGLIPQMAAMLLTILFI